MCAHYIKKFRENTSYFNTYFNKNDNDNINDSDSIKNHCVRRYLCSNS